MMSNFEIQIDLNVLNHLGMSLYSNTPAVLTEIISNAWDADATVVDINLDTTPKNESVIIKDNGHGMSENDIVNKFLKVGYARRDDNRELSDGLNRQVMGRKGIGKLAMFSLANKIRIYSAKTGYEKKAFEIDVGELQRHIKLGKSYIANELEFDVDLNKGTVIKLYELKKSINKTQTYLRKRIARRFSIIGDGNNFAVKINGNPIKPEDRDFLSDLEFIWEFGESVSSRINACSKLIKKRNLDNKIEYNGNVYSISGYIGSVSKPSDLKKDPEISNNTIAILSNGRVFEEDLLQEFGSAKVFTNYLVGELVADFLDDNSMPDMATSSRQQLQENDPRYHVLKTFFNRYLSEIDKDWDSWRREKGLQDIEKTSPKLQSWLNKLQKREKKAAEKLLGKVNTFRFSGSEEQQNESKRAVLKNTILAFEKLRVQDNLDQLDNMENLDSSSFKNVFSSVDDIEASLFYDIINQRLKIIEKFSNLTDDNALERTVQRYLYQHLWLLDPSWERSTGESYIEQTLTKELKEIDPDATKGARIDIAYKAISGNHVIIEMKRPKVKTEIEDLVKQGRKYQLATKQWYHNNEDPSKTPHIEIIFLLGNKFDLSDEYNISQLKSINAKILTYQELITQSRQSYKEYVDKKEEASTLRELIDSL